MREENEAIQLICPKCRFQIINYAPLDNLSRRPECDKYQIIIKEVLDGSNV